MTQPREGRVCLVTLPVVGVVSVSIVTVFCLRPQSTQLQLKQSATH